MYTTRPNELSSQLTLLLKKPVARQEATLPHKSHDRAAEIHRLAGVAHAAAAAAHSRGDYASAAELSKQACAYSLRASESGEVAAGTASA
jgi:hypothetical protein